METIKLLSIQGKVKPAVRFRTTKGGKNILTGGIRVELDIIVEIENELRETPRVGQVVLLDHMPMMCIFIDDMSIKFRNVKSESTQVNLSFSNETTIRICNAVMGEGDIKVIETDDFKEFLNNCIE